MSREITPSARRVLELLRAADRPVKAYDLMRQLEDGRLAKPPTVYRALNQLMTLGLAHKVYTLDAFTACASPDEPHYPLLRVCPNCRRTSELLVTGEDLQRLLPGGDFFTSLAVLELTGVCEDCS